MLERCAALDVHKAQVTVCARILGPGGELEELIVEFSTMTADLLALRDWLRELGVTHVAMEATGVFWKPVYYVLEDDFELLLVKLWPSRFMPIIRYSQARTGARPWNWSRPRHAASRVSWSRSSAAWADPTIR
jgi:hypothetical protein